MHCCTGSCGLEVGHCQKVRNLCWNIFGNVRNGNGKYQKYDKITLKKEEKDCCVIYVWTCSIISTWGNHKDYKM